VNAHTISALVVDDEPLARRRIVRLLARDPEFGVVAACASVGEATDIDPAAQVDLVLLDIRMPERDGFALLEALHERGIDPFVIFVTAYSGMQRRRSTSRRSTTSSSRSTMSASPRPLAAPRASSSRRARVSIVSRPWLRAHRARPTRAAYAFPGGC